jgi:signal transduction histidine kinase
MKTLWKIVLPACILAFSAGAANAADNPAEAKALVEKGAAYVKQHGKAALIDAINHKDPAFINGNIYLAARAADGTTLAHPINPRVIGKNMIELPDADGKYYRKDILNIAAKQGSGWVDYRYNNPATGDIERKATYFMRVDDIILEAGIYKGK